LLDEVLHWFTSNVDYCAVEHIKREHGQSGYSIWKLAIMLFNYVVYYTLIPIRVMTYTGFLFSLVSFVFSVGFLYRWLVKDVPPGFTAIIIAIFFTASVILFSLGILGEYISRIYVQEISKPLYVIKEIR